MRSLVVVLTFLGSAVPLASQRPAEPPAPAVRVGEPAPRFRLNDHEGRAVRVGGRSKTWTVVAFYPKAATPG